MGECFVCVDEASLVSFSSLRGIFIFIFRELGVQKKMIDDRGIKKKKWIITNNFPEPSKLSINSSYFNLIL